MSLYDNKMRSLKDKIVDKALDAEIEDVGKNDLDAAKGKRTKKVKKVSAKLKSKRSK